MKPKIAFISLMPDAGHVTPLMRLADAFAQQEYEVKGFFPEECATLAEEFNIPMKSLGKVTSLANKEVFNKLSKHSLFYNAFSYYKDTLVNYIHPITLAVAPKIELVKELLAEYDPELIIADHHHNPLFENCYLSLAQYLKKEVVFHVSGGNDRFYNRHDQVNHHHKFYIRGRCYRYHYDRFVYNYGFSGHSPLMQSLLIYFGEKLDKRCRKLIKSETENSEANFNHYLVKAFPGVNVENITPAYISTGIPFIEREVTKNYFVSFSPPFGQNLFPPTKDKRKMGINPSLKQWIDEAHDKPIVYICFGTVVKCKRRLIKKIIRGLSGLDVLILWSAPPDQIKLIQEISSLPNLRTEEHVPQQQILALDQIRCFISHGGAGGVQDSLWNGKPMLCIPFMFDQPFNSSVVEMLGAGIKLWRHRLTAKSIHDSVGKLLYEPEYGNAAREMMKKLGGEDSGNKILRFFRDKNILKA